jgi:ABC-2 type transport system ATP-binding protein
MKQSIQSPVAIQLNDLKKVYKKRGGKDTITAVNSIDLEVKPGQIFGFLGPNGAGKTTTIKMACGLVTPTSGRILLNGHDVVKERSQAMRQIGAVLEGTRNVYWRLSAWNNVMYFGGLKGMSGKALKQRAEMLLRELDLWDRRKDSVRLFSRGMIQKVAIACALISDPSIVLLDEPTLGLDVQAARTVKSWIEKLAREKGKTVILTTHQLDMAQNLCDRIAIISKGSLVTNQPTHELLDIFRQEYYQIKIKGHLNGQKKALQSTLNITEENGTTILTGAIPNQNDLFRYLDMIRESGLPLISVQQTAPDLEEVFIKYTEQEDKEGK